MVGWKFQTVGLATEKVNVGHEDKQQYKQQDKEAIHRRTVSNKCQEHVTPQTCWYPVFVLQLVFKQPDVLLKSFFDWRLDAGRHRLSLLFQLFQLQEPCYTTTLTQWFVTHSSCAIINANAWHGDNMLSRIKLLTKKVRYSYLLQKNVTWRLPEWSALWSR